LSKILGWSVFESTTKKMVTTGYSYKGLIKGKMVIEQTN
jgi:hypothetical protein